MRPFVLCALAATLLLAVAGCQPNSGSKPEASSASNADNKANTANMGEAATSGGEVIHNPNQAKDGGSYRITPANPNDEKYKPDPRLAGGN